MKKKCVRIDVVANNYPSGSGFQVGWGNACLIRRMGRFVLFDTGGDGEFLLHNLKKLKVRPSEVGDVVISHDHDDHTGGLWGLLAINRKARVFAPASVSRLFKDRVLSAGARLVSVSEPIKICDAIHSTGQMRGLKWEQSLAVRTPEGLVILTGCAHPGVVRIVERCMKLLKDKPYHLLGGFHLRDAASGKIDGVIRRLRRLGVARISPNHCTGAMASRRFKAAWGKDYVETGCGATIEI